MNLRAAHVLTLGYVVIAAGLVALRALVSDLAFISTGWILVFATVPLLPWLLPQLGPMLKAISPYVESLKVGAVQIDLRQAEPVVARLGAVGDVLAPTLAPPPAGPAADFYSTHVHQIIGGIQQVHAEGAGLVVVDLQDGHKWRLPNLYLLARLLETDALIHHLVFTEARGGTDGYLVGICTPRELRVHIEASRPPYAAAAHRVLMPSDLTAAGADESLATQFNEFRRQLAQVEAGAIPPPDDFIYGQVGTALLQALLGPALSVGAIEARDPATYDDLRAIVRSPDRYVAATAVGIFTTVIDRDAVALAIARKAITRQG